jgi:cytochrome c peroxidase
MRALIFVTAILLLVICGYSIYESTRSKIAAEKNVFSWYEPALVNLSKKLENLCIALATHQSAEHVQQAFCESRLAYKRIEVFAEYFSPYTVQLINGRGDDTTANGNRQAFQTLESLLYPALQTADTQAAYIAARKLMTAVNSLSPAKTRPAPTDAQLFDAMRLELVRIMALSLSGFDSPNTGQSLKETAAALDGLKSIWSLYADRVNIYNPTLVQYTEELLTAAHKSLEDGRPERFNKQAFITDYINHLSVNLKLSREALSIPYDNESYILDPAASNVFARNAVHPLYTSSDALVDSAGSHDPLYNINGQQFRASYIYTLLQQNGALNTVADGSR